MPTWFDLEKRFEELCPALGPTRLDSLTGGAGEHWNLTASFNAVAEARFPPFPFN